MREIRHILQSSDNAFRAVYWGLNTDKPVMSGYDGDGRTDICGGFSRWHWYLLQSTDGTSIEQCGLVTDEPVPSAHFP